MILKECISQNVYFELCSCISGHQHLTCNTNAWRFKHWKCQSSSAFKQDDNAISEMHYFIKNRPNFALVLIFFKKTLCSEVDEVCETNPWIATLWNLFRKHTTVNNINTSCCLHINLTYNSKTQYFFWVQWINFWRHIFVSCSVSWNT